MICCYSFITSAQMNADSLLHIIKTSHSKSDLAKANDDYAFLLCRIKPDSAIYFAQKAIEIALEINDEKTLNSAYSVLGLSYATKAIYSLSIQNFDKALLYNKDDGMSRAKVYHNKALTYRKIKNNTEALKSELEALKINDKDSLLTGVIYETLCNIYRDLNDFTLAEEYIKKAVSIFENISEGKDYNRTALLANAYVDYGNLMQVSENYEEAVSMHKKAIQLHELSGDLYNKAISSENLGTDYYLLKQYENAIEAYTYAKILMDSLKSPINSSYELLNIAMAYGEMNQLEIAMAKTDSAIALLLNMNAETNLLEAYQLKYELYDKMQKPAEALKYYKMYNTIKDSLNMEGQASELLRLKEEYETNKKEQQITLLTAENQLKEKEKEQQVVLRNIALAGILIFLLMAFLLFNRYQIKQQAKELQMRNAIALDLHDEVGSTLSSIKMYSEIVQAQLENKNPESVLLLEKMGTNSKEMIDTMSDIVWAIKPDNDAFKNIESRMMNFVTELCRAKGIELIMEKNHTLDELKIEMDERKDLYLIFKEAVNNAVKYSECTQLKVEFKKINNTFSMLIADNGNGFDSSIKKSGNGLESMKKRAASHNAQLKIDSEINNGTTIQFSMNI